MKLKRKIAYLLCLSLFTSSCVTPGGEQGEQFDIGPKLSSFFNQPSEELNIPIQNAVKLDVIIPVFDPGITEKNSDNSEKNSDNEADDIWPELRRAESTKFALMMKRALEKTEAFGAVRVSPNKNSTGDLYVLGKIEESNVKT